MGRHDTAGPPAAQPIFYTVAEVAELLRVDKATIYRAIREDAFPAVQIRSRYVIPSMAVERMAAEAAERRGCVDVAGRTAERRVTREATWKSGTRW